MGKKGDDSDSNSAARRSGSVFMGFGKEGGGFVGFTVFGANGKEFIQAHQRAFRIMRAMVDTQAIFTDPLAQAAEGG